MGHFEQGESMNHIDAGLVERAKADPVELLALGALLNKERNRDELTFSELLERYRHVGLTSDIAGSACHEEELARRLEKARGINRTFSSKGGHAR